VSRWSSRPQARGEKYAGFSVTASESLPRWVPTGREWLWLPCRHRAAGLSRGASRARGPGAASSCCPFKACRGLAEGVGPLRLALCTRPMDGDRATKGSPDTCAKPRGLRDRPSRCGPHSARVLVVVGAAAWTGTVPVPPWEHGTSTLGVDAGSLEAVKVVGGCEGGSQGGRGGKSV
jgi:hypothetical protein